MAGNTGSGHRKGAVKDRSQYYNPKTKQFVKRDEKTGRFLASKNTPFKGVTKKGTAKKVNPPKKANPVPQRSKKKN